MTTSKKCLGSKEYLMDEIRLFLEFCGKKSFWNDIEKADRALDGLMHVYLQTPDLTTSEEIMFVGIVENYQRRKEHMLAKTLF